MRHRLRHGKQTQLTSQIAVGFQGEQFNVIKINHQV